VAEQWLVALPMLVAVAALAVLALSLLLVLGFLPR
jgi:hypothetical protein